MKHTLNKTLALCLSVATVASVQAAQQKLTIQWSTQTQLCKERNDLRRTLSKQQTTDLDKSLAVAIHQQKRADVKKYLEQGAEPNSTTFADCNVHNEPHNKSYLGLAANYPSTDIVQDLLDAGAIVNEQVMEDAAAQRRYTGNVGTLPLYLPQYPKKTMALLMKAMRDVDPFYSLDKTIWNAYKTSQQ